MSPELRTFRSMGVDVLVAAQRSPSSPMFAACSTSATRRSQPLPGGERAEPDQCRPALRSWCSRAVRVRAARGPRRGRDRRPRRPDARRGARGGRLRPRLRRPRPTTRAARARPSPGAGGRSAPRPPSLRARRDRVLDLNGVVKALAVDAALELIGGDARLGWRRPRGARRHGLSRSPAASRSRCSPAGSRRAGRRAGAGAGRRPGSTICSTRARAVRLESPLDRGDGRRRQPPAADVAAKAAFLSAEDGPDWLDGPRAAGGRFVLSTDAVVNDAWRRARQPA